jgi:hypothetical protein
VARRAHSVAAPWTRSGPDTTSGMQAVLLVAWTVRRAARGAGGAGGWGEEGREEEGREEEGGGEEGREEEGREEEGREGKGQLVLKRTTLHSEGGSWTRHTVQQPGAAHQQWRPMAVHRHSTSGRAEQRTASSERSERSEQ